MTLDHTRFIRLNLMFERETRTPVTNGACGRRSHLHGISCIVRWTKLPLSIRMAQRLRGAPVLVIRRAFGQAPRASPAAYPSGTGPPDPVTSVNYGGMSVARCAERISQIRAPAKMLEPGTSFLPGQSECGG